MRKILFAIMVLCLLVAPAWAADMVWDLDDDHALVDGYTVYFTDGVDNYNYTFSANETVVVDQTVRWGPIDETLNLQPGTTYTFTLARFTEWGQSGLSNEAVYTTEGIDPYTPPENQVPATIIYIPGPITITIGQ